MSFDFDGLLQKGKGAAEDVIKNSKEVKAVLQDLENSLSKFLDLPLELVEYVEYVEEELSIKFANPFKPKEKTGFDVVLIVSKQVDVRREVFKLKRSDDIYPVTVVRERNHSVASNQDEFAASIGGIASNSQFHLQLKSFKRQVEDKLKEKSQGVPKSE